MIISSNTPLLKTQEYFNKVSTQSSDTKNRKAIFKFTEALYDLNLWYKMVFLFLTPDKNTNTDKIYSLGGLLELTSIGNNINWSIEGIEFNGTSSYINTNFKPSFIDTQNINNTAQGNICTFCDIINPGENVTLGAVNSTITRDAKFAFDISTKKPVSYSCYWEDETKTSEVSGSAGFWLASTKSTSTTSETYIQKNGQTINNINFSGTDFVVDKNVYVGCYNNINNEPDNFTQQKIAFLGFGQQIEQNLAKELYNIYKSITESDFIFLTTHSRFLPVPVPSPTIPLPVTPSVTPSTSNPSVTPSVTPSTSNPSVTPSVTPSTSGPEVTPSVTPSTSGPEVTPSVTPSTSGPEVTPSSSSPTPSVTPSVSSGIERFLNKLTGVLDLDQYIGEDESRIVSITAPQANNTIFYNNNPSSAANQSMKRMMIFLNGVQQSAVDFPAGFIGQKFGYNINVNAEYPLFIGTFVDGDVTLL